MERAFIMGGGAPRLQNYQVSETVSNRGIPLLASTGDETGLDLPSTTNISDMVGLAIDTATYVTAQQTDGSSAERTVRVRWNPDLAIRARMSGDGTTGTALTIRTVDTVSADGLTITTGDDWTSSPNTDSGTVWGYSGANTAQRRKITSATSVACLVKVAFDQDTVVGDRFLFAPFWPGDLDSDNVTMTSDFREIDTSADKNNATGTLVPFFVEFLDASGDGSLKSSVLMLPGDHHFAPRLT